MLQVGITGGIGSGKSTVARIFMTLGIPVYFADVEARRMMQEDPELIRGITHIFGADAYQSGTLNRPFISKEAFSHPEKLDKLNALVHPRTIADAQQWMKATGKPYALKEAALIFESGSEKHLDYVIGVWAPAELRILRAVTRDQSGRDAVLARMEKQMDEKEKMNRCDFVIHNDESELLIPQVIQIHETLLKLAEAKKEN